MSRKIVGKKPQSIPNIDLGGTFSIIDESTMPPRWKTIGRGYATAQQARKLMLTHGLAGIWMRDDLGYSTYITP